MALNRTRFKTLDVVNDDPRVHDCYQDSDGIWLEGLAPGWTGDPHDAHDIHEDRVAAVLDKYRRIVPCACAECVGRTSVTLTLTEGERALLRAAVCDAAHEVSRWRADERVTLRGVLGKLDQAEAGR